MTEQNPYANHSDNDIFNEYWRVVDDINEHENAEFYEHETDEYNLNLLMIDQLCEEADALEREAARRNLSLKWHSNQED